MSSSPIATTSAILGASSAGWSPQRSPRRQMMSSNEMGDQTPSDFGSEQGSPSRMRVPEHRANLGSLRSHGLVSNSIFKSAGGNPSPQSSYNYSPNQSPSRQSPNRMSAASPNSQQRFGVGLGISATPSKTNTSSPSKTNSFIRSTSNSSINSNQSNSDAENEANVTRYTQNSPRKSTNFKRLEKANYVSNSPFRRNGAFENAQEDFELPNNAWAKSAALNHSNRSPNRDLQTSRFGTDDQTDASNATIRPQTPERTPERLATAHGQGDVDLCTPTSNGTPRNGRRSIMNASAVDSPSSAKGLLVSNRLHGPRSMMENGSGTDSPMESPTKRERRKTVTFDEVLDVQEFDRESSFDRDSMQSASSDSGSLNGVSRHLSFNGEGIQREHSGGSSSDEDAMWLQSDLGAQKVVERLMVINASPESQSSAFSTPDLIEAPKEQGMHSIQTRTQEQQQQQQDALNDASSNDSRDLSSLDEPQSPQAADLSLSQSGDKSYRTAADGTIYHDGPYVEGDSDVSGGNLSAYGALHRVESMVDELLGDELLDGRTKEQQQQGQQFVPHLGMHLSESQEQEAQNLPDNQNCDSPPRRRRAAGPKLGEEIKAAKVLPHPPVKPIEVQQVPLSLPEWSPLMKEDNTTSSTYASEKSGSRMMAGRATGSSIPTNSAPAEAIQSPRTNGRPHISRDAVLQRVAKEKMLQQEQQERKCEGTPDARYERDTKVVELPKSQKPLMTSSRRSEPERRQSPQKDADQPIQIAAQQVGPTRQLASGEQRSPLERLATELDAEVAAEEQKIRREQDYSLNESTHSSSSSLTKIEKASESSASTSKKQLLDANVDQDGFESGLRREFSRIYRQGDSKYHVKDRGAFTSLVAPELGRPAAIGQEKNESNIDQQDSKKEANKAWRKLRRPSDMNEYAKEMREYRAKENPKKVAGKVFVMVDSFTPANLPVPSKPTRFYCVLDNGLHVVRTATAGLRSNGPSKVGQEFELIQHRNLTFNLTLVAQRDSHLQEPSPLPTNESSPSSSMKRDRLTPSFSRGVGKLFSSPKKRQASSAASVYGASSNSIVDQARPFDPLMAFMNREGAFGQSEVVFEQIAQDCLAQCHIVELPVRAVAEPPAPAPQSTATEMYNSTSIPARIPALATEFSRNFNKIRGTLRLKVFYLPPMPGISKSLLPESLSECIKGMESARWHAGQPWMEGTLTQLGGDCQSWRRRPVKAQGAHLIGFNEITKKPTVKIDLSKAISIEENHDPHKKTGGKAYNDDEEEFDETYHVERSFRITFKDGERIFFFADTDEEMHRWLNALSKIVGNTQIPPQCAWSQLALDMLRAKRTNTNENKSREQSDRTMHPSINSNAMSKTPLGPSKSYTQERPGKLSPTREQEE